MLLGHVPLATNEGSVIVNAAPAFRGEENATALIKGQFPPLVKLLSTFQFIGHSSLPIQALMVDWHLAAFDLFSVKGRLIRGDVYVGMAAAGKFAPEATNHLFINWAFGEEYVDTFLNPGM
jgi:hypothetical protein